MTHPHSTNTHIPQHHTNTTHSWGDEAQLQEMYVNRKSYAFNSDRPGAGGEMNKEMFVAAMKTVDVTLQNLDSSEISLTDVSHYLDSDPTKLVQGLRGDGKLPSSFIADSTTANAQVWGEVLGLGVLGVLVWGLVRCVGVGEMCEGVVGCVGDGCDDVMMNKRENDVFDVFDIVPHPPTQQHTAPSPPTTQVRSLAETVRLDSRTKLLNPKWYEGMMASGYEGVREIQKRLTNTLGWSATSGQVCVFCYGFVIVCSFVIVYYFVIHMFILSLCVLLMCRWSLLHYPSSPPPDSITLPHPTHVHPPTPTHANTKPLPYNNPGGWLGV